MHTNLIGIDCATNPRDVGLAFGEFRDGVTRLLRLTTGSAGNSVAEMVSHWIGRSERCLIALDAPLGWPAPLANALAGHIAGAPLAGSPNQLFRRATDQLVKDRIGKRPLDVGAERIARTAHWALKLLQALRERTGEGLPLAWQADFRERVCAIETYPAGTLQVYGLRASGYKEPQHRDLREQMRAGLAQHMALETDTDLMLDDADALDAAVCILAASDFLNARALAPTDLSLAHQEGWIWVRDPATHTP